MPSLVDKRVVWDSPPPPLDTFASRAAGQSTLELAQKCVDVLFERCAQGGNPPMHGRYTLNDRLTEPDVIALVQGGQAAEFGRNFVQCYQVAYADAKRGSAPVNISDEIKEAFYEDRRSFSRYLPTKDLLPIACLAYQTRGADYLGYLLVQTLAQRMAKGEALPIADIAKELVGLPLPQIATALGIFPQLPRIAYGHRVGSELGLFSLRSSHWYASRTEVDFSSYKEGEEALLILDEIARRDTRQFVRLTTDIVRRDCEGHFSVDDGKIHWSPDLAVALSSPDAGPRGEQHVGERATVMHWVVNSRFGRQVESLMGFSFGSLPMVAREGLAWVVGSISPGQFGAIAVELGAVPPEHRNSVAGLCGAFVGREAALIPFLRAARQRGELIPIAEKYSALTGKLSSLRDGAQKLNPEKDFDDEILRKIGACFLGRAHGALYALADTLHESGVGPSGGDQADPAVEAALSAWKNFEGTDSELIFLAAAIRVLVKQEGMSLRQISGLDVRLAAPAELGDELVVQMDTLSLENCLELYGETEGARIYSEYATAMRKLETRVCVASFDGKLISFLRSEPHESGDLLVGSLNTISALKGGGGGTAILGEAIRIYGQQYNLRAWVHPKNPMLPTYISQFSFVRNDVLSDGYVEIRRLRT